ncbi:hypothetical protein I4F81_003383 [Pyropia yezoensis]|uniref:Uncharacterized protein n=1 Tax=Pyropia yezoensis TaxID=2788 RepID=A0ACC3BTN1_PYRYE|nr:hypothetical protein I4F81_003383 [Neopyropia yezoensis]
MASPPPPPPVPADVDPSAASRLALRGRRALVTGGHRGIGRAVALGLAAAGAHVAVIDRGGSRASDVPSRVRGYGVEYYATAADLADGDAALAAVGRVQTEFGAIDILVNNAGITELQPLVRTPAHPRPPVTAADWDAQFAVNVRAPMLLATAVAPAMMAARRGKVINVSSQAGTAALPLHGAYGASKAALDHLTRTMAAEWGPYGIQANAVAPTVIASDMGDAAWPPGDPRTVAMLARIPAGRFGQAWEVADLVVFLAGGGSDLISGQVLGVDGGYTAA